MVWCNHIWIVQQQRCLGYPILRLIDEHGIQWSAVQRLGFSCAASIGRERGRAASSCQNASDLVAAKRRQLKAGVGALLSRLPRRACATGIPLRIRLQQHRPEHVDHPISARHALAGIRAAAEIDQITPARRAFYPHSRALFERHGVPSATSNKTS
jgi:hypothetical protein